MIAGIAHLAEPWGIRVFMRKPSFLRMCLPPPLPSGEGRPACAAPAGRGEGLHGINCMVDFSDCIGIDASTTTRTVSGPKGSRPSGGGDIRHPGNPVRCVPGRAKAPRSPCPGPESRFGTGAYAKALSIRNLQPGSQSHPGIPGAFSYQRFAERKYLATPIDTATNARENSFGRQPEAPQAAAAHSMSDDCVDRPRRTGDRQHKEFYQ